MKLQSVTNQNGEATDFYVLLPECPGAPSKDVKLDRSSKPTKIVDERLRLEFDSWSGSALVEPWHCHCVTEPLRHDIENAQLTGCRFVPVVVYTTALFYEDYSEEDMLPTFYWMKVDGTLEIDDFSLSEEGYLVVSDQALEVVLLHPLEACEVEPYRKKEQPSKRTQRDPQSFRRGLY